MRKLLIVALISLLVFVLTGCSTQRILKQEGADEIFYYHDEVHHVGIWSNNSGYHISPIAVLPDSEYQNAGQPMNALK